MREILFRGKTKDGQWLKGDLLQYADTAQIWVQEESGKNNYLVDPATVGQFTGLYDKNGVKIFEGDIVKDCDTDRCFEVRYERNSFIRRTEEGFFLYTFDCSCLEVIDNIHDTPDLRLKEESE